MEHFINNVIQNFSLKTYVGNETSNYKINVEGFKTEDFIRIKRNLVKYKSLQISSIPYSEFVSKLLVVLVNTNEFEKYLLKKNFTSLFTKALTKIDLSLAPILKLSSQKIDIPKVKSFIDDLTNSANNVFQPEADPLTETEFKLIFKTTCMSQNIDFIKSQVTEERYDEFSHKKLMYITKYKYLIPDIMTEVQKDLSNSDV